jgi:hypothetical protein
LTLIDQSYHFVLRQQLPEHLNIMAGYNQVPEGSNAILAGNGMADALHRLSPAMQPITVSHARQVVLPAGPEER